MSKIYKITNNINGKIYIGKTETTISKRFKAHVNDSKRERCRHRPLYRAFNKYGIENFSIELIEETSSKDVNKREIFWIEYYNSYHFGYNATKGADGKSYLDYDKIVELYLRLKRIESVAKIMNCSTDSVLTVLQDRGIPCFKDHLYIAVRGRNRTTGITLEFDSMTKASEYLVQLRGLDVIGGFYCSHISACCRKKKKSILDFEWEYIRVEEESNRLVLETSRGGALPPVLTKNEDCSLAGDASTVLNAVGAERPGFRLRLQSAK